MQVFSRPPNDRFSFSLARELVELVPPGINYESYYHWAGTIGKLDPFLKLSFNSPNVVICLRDHLSTNGEFNPWTTVIQQGAFDLATIAKQNSDKNFVLLVGVEDLEKEINYHNITIVPMGGCIVNQQDLYPTLAPVIDKNFNSNKIFCSLNRHPRNHRITIASILYGLHLNHCGTITFLSIDKIKNNKYLDLVDWDFDGKELIRDTIIDGYNKLILDMSNSSSKFDIYEGANNNVGNFQSSLRNIYKNTFVEIVSETSYTETAFDVTEKFLNSVYGCNFPIIFGSAGMVNHLRDVGFDMFDDIVDHSYDQILNPIDRLNQAIIQNLNLLTDTHTIKLWEDNKHRFLKNVDHARENMYNFYKNRAHKQFKLIKWN